LTSAERLSSGRKFIMNRKRPGHARDLLVVEDRPAQDLAPVRLGAVAAELAGLVHHPVLDHARLGQDRAVRVENRHLAHRVDGAELRAAGLALEEIDEAWGPGVPDSSSVSAAL
jgi:hypothetical protein